MDNIAISGNFEITPCEQIADIESRTGFKKLALTSAQKIQMGGLTQQLPAVMATGALSGCYMVQFPDGLPDGSRLMQYKLGGEGTPIQGADGKIVGHASLHDMTVQTMALGMLNIMSMASGQYFLSQINSELKIMNQKMDKILDFLYGEKKAELMAEISFVKYAYENYISIMEHDEQRIATISGLQDSRKVAMKDIEFYMSDLDSIVNKEKKSDVEDMVTEASKLKGCLELSMQLYAMSSLLETYYSQNRDKNYIRYIEEDAMTYLTKCESRIFGDFSILKSFIQSSKDNLLKKTNKTALLEIVEPVINVFGEGKESAMRKSFRQVLHASEAKAEYYVNSNGDLYLRTA